MAKRRNSEPGPELPEQGFQRLKEVIILNKIEFVLAILRFVTFIFTLGYFIPGFWNPYVLYYKILMSNALICALRLHQRHPQVTFNLRCLYELLIEDSCHYLFYTIIFYPLAPFAFVLQPIFLFSLLHSASHALNYLDHLGQNNMWAARILISMVELYSRNILRLVSISEIFLMAFTVILVVLGRASLWTVAFYYEFLCLRYSSRRNPYTRNIFHELRIFLENFANKPGTPTFARQFVHTVVSVTSRIGQSELLSQG